MLDGREHAENTGVVDETVEAAIAIHQRGGECVVVRRHGFFQIERRDRRLRPARGFDLRMHGFEPLHVASDQNHRCAVRGASHRKRVPDAASRPRNRDDAAGKLVGADGDGAWVE